MTSLGNAYRHAGKLDRALPLLEEALARHKARTGADHIFTLYTMLALGNAYRQAGKLDRALPLLEEALAILKAKLGPDHPDTLYGSSLVANGYRDGGKLDRALPLLEDTLARQRAKLGTGHMSTLFTMTSLAECYSTLDQLERARSLFEEALSLIKADLGPDPGANLAYLARGMAALAARFEDSGKLDRALSLRREIVDVWKRRDGSDSPRYAEALASIGSNLIRQKLWADAEPILRPALMILEAKQHDDWTTFGAKSLLGGALLGQGRTAEAEPLLRSGYEGMKARSDKIPAESGARLAEALDRLIAFGEAAGKTAEVAAWKAERAGLSAGAATPKAERK